MENKILKWALIASIIIVANLFFNYGLSFVFNAPKYDEYCFVRETKQIAQEEQTCVQAGGEWVFDQHVNLVDSNNSGYCDLYTVCNQKYQDANKSYEQKVFISLILIGVLVLISSFFIKTNFVLSSSFALAAVLDFIIASIRYWSYSDELLKVLMLFVALVLLVYIAVKKFTK